MQGFGEAPAYTIPTVFTVATLSLLGGFTHAVLSVMEMHAALVPGALSVALALTVFLFGLMLLIRYLEARDALNDARPRSRQYDRHERYTYLAGLGASLLVAINAAGWSHASSVGDWHFLAVALNAAAALLYLRLWLKVLNP